MPIGRKKIIKDQVELDLSIDQDDLTDEIMNQPLLFKKYSDLDSECQRALNDCLNYLKLVEAEIHLKVSNDNPKMKVRDLEALVITNDKVQEIKAKLVELEEQASKIRGVLRAAQQRHDMLKELSYNKRKELE